MSRRYRSEQSANNPRQNRALLWLGIGTVVVLGGLFALSRGSIKETTPTDTVADRRLDRVMDDLLTEEDSDEGLTFNKRKRKQSTKRSKTPKASEPLASALAKKKSATQTPSPKPRVPLVSGTAESDPNFKLTEAELITLSREASGSDDPVITLPKVPGAPSGVAATPSRNGSSYSIGPERLFTLLVLGSLGGETIPRDDAQTWDRMGYFLQNEAPRRFFLVQPNGNVKVILPKGFKGDFPPTPVAEGEPEFRLVLRSSTSRGQGLTFYGKKLASSFRCTIQCTIEQRNGEEYKVVDGLRVTEQFTPTRKVDQTTILRTAYDMALQKLVADLGRRGFFHSRV